MSAVYKFKSLDWVKNIVQANHNLAKKHVDPTAAFNFEEDFSVGTIHGKNNAIHAQKIGKEATEVIELTDDDALAYFRPRHKTNLLPLLFRSGEGACSQLEPGLPPVPGLQSLASLPMLPPPEQQGRYPSQQRDLRSRLAPEPTVVVMVGRAANTCQRPLL